MSFIKYLILSSFIWSFHILAQDSNLISENANKLALTFYKNITKSSQSNFIFSPISITTAVAQIYIGSERKTKNEITDVFYFNDDVQLFKESFHNYSNKLFKYDDSLSIKLSNANSIWIDKNIKLKNDYMVDLSYYFNSEVFELDLEKKNESIKKVNSWVTDNTNNRIKKILNVEDIKGNTALLILNAIYFKDRWKVEFKKDSTKDDDFFLLNGEKITTKMMNNISNYGYSANENYESILLPYNTENFSMLVLLPREIDGLTDLEINIDDINIDDLLTNIIIRKIHLSLPQFKFQFSLNNLKVILSDLGMSTAFNRDYANFKKIYDEEYKNLYVEDVKHKAFIEVNEEGTEAAAVTAIIGGIVTISVKKPPLNVKIDHPFLFIIIEKNTKSILFIGRVLNPEEKSL
ncbi:MAG: serpin family protein [Bacteroidetes bacterium]|nr:serpin family protein [Bacteroidota bacterium]